MLNIGIDVGGTAIKAAIVENGKIIQSIQTPTPDGSKVPAAIADAAKKLMHKTKTDKSEIHSVGIGTTGVCDTKRGIVISSANIADYENIEICSIVTEKLGIPSYIDNDANCAALGEYTAFGVSGDFIFVTLGTGIGGGIILNGSLLHGINGGAGEIGHTVIKSSGELCNCGRHGCWERYASVSALVRQSKQGGLGDKSDGRTAFEKAQKGDHTAKEILEIWLRYVAIGIANLVNTFQPELIVIGGGVSREGDKLLEPIRHYVKHHTMTGTLRGVPQTRIEVSRLFNDAGTIGAAMLYTQHE